MSIRTVVIVSFLLAALVAASPAAAQQQGPREYDSFGDWGRDLKEDGQEAGSGIGAFFRQMGRRENWWPKNPDVSWPPTPGSARNPSDDPAGPAPAPARRP